LNVCNEARVWERLKYDIPVVIQPVYKKWDQLKFMYETVLTIVLDYNQVIEGKIYLNMHYMHVCVMPAYHMCTDCVCISYTECPI
jgi:hypothetical protein